MLIVSNILNTVTLSNMKTAGKGIHFHTHIGAASVSVRPPTCVYTQTGDGTTLLYLTAL